MFHTFKRKIGIIIIAMSSLSHVVAANDQQKQIEANLYKRTWFSGNKQTQVSIVERMAEIRLAGASVAVINNGKLDWAAGYGIANSKTNAKVDDETLFQAGSIPKLPQDACFRAITALSGQGTLAKECGYLSNKCNAVMEAL